ncbi:hypothetical protein GCM10009564_53920 [Streptomyces thermogriseus]|uniref:Uncharacterized protein n=1 Tax=Streptomyces thermogriseus TaxID=75292 RepID=A0ABP4DTA8_9ACTN
MPQYDLPAHGDLLGAEPEGDGLHGERLVDAGGQVERADHDVLGAAVSVTGKVDHAGRLQGTHRPQNRVVGRMGAGRRKTARRAQNSTLMNAPTSRKPTRR